MIFLRAATPLPVFALSTLETHLVAWCTEDPARCRRAAVWTICTGAVALLLVGSVLNFLLRRALGGCMDWLFGGGRRQQQRRRGRRRRGGPLFRDTRALRRSGAAASPPSSWQLEDDPSGDDVELDVEHGDEHGHPRASSPIAMEERVGE